MVFSLMTSLGHYSVTAEIVGSRHALVFFFGFSYLLVKLAKYARSTGI